MKKTDLAHLLRTARHPEDVFGKDVAGDFKTFVKIVHPDKNPGDPEAGTLFNLLENFYRLAKIKLANKTYGDRKAVAEPIVLRTKTNVYTISSLLASGDICQVYAGTNKDGQNVTVKVTRARANNDLSANEAALLSFLGKESKSARLPVMAYVSTLLDSFTVPQGKEVRQVTVLKRLENHYTLAEVIKAYPDGLHLGDAAWMINRLLAGLLAAHQGGLVHGAVTPDHVMISPEDHGGVLIDWSYAVRKGGIIKAVCPAYQSLYPDDVLNKVPATFGIDLHMAAKVGACLLSGNTTGNLPPNVDKRVAGLLRACTLGPVHRENDVYRLFKDFKQVLENVLGKPRFRPFKMPVR